MKTHVVKISPDATLRQATDLMDLYQVCSLPVVDTEGRLCGMLSEADVIRCLGLNDWRSNRDSSSSVSTAVNEGRADALRMQATGVAEQQVQISMTAPAISVSEHVSVFDAAHTMFRHRLKRLPVLDEEERVVGVLNRIDLIQALFDSYL